MAEDEDRDDMQEPGQGESPVSPDQNEPRARWRRRGDGRAAQATGEQAQANRSAQDGAAATKDAADVLTGAQRAQVEQEVKERMAVEQAKADEAVKSLQRVQADFANYKRRSEQEREQQARFANMLLVTELLPVLDNFDRALATIPEEVRNMPWTDGLLLVARQLRATLEKQGLQPIEAVGHRFDPMLHEAIIHEESPDHADDEVIAELQRGYMLHDKVVRPTLVKVAKHVAHA